MNTTTESNPLVADFEIVFNDHFQPLLSLSENLDSGSLDSLSGILQDALVSVENSKKGTPRAVTQLGKE